MAGLSAFVELRGGQLTLIDAADFDRVRDYALYLTPTGYVGFYPGATAGKKVVLLHRLLTDAPPKLHVDHLNGDKLDNRRANLRVTTSSLNQVNRKRLDPKNTTGARGIEYIGSSGRWRARLIANGVTRHLGCFPTFEDALVARAIGELRYYGELCPTTAESVSRVA